MKPRAQFITFEGGEGAGKSTQISFAAGLLAEAGIPHIITREPGGSKGAEAIRELIVTGETGRWDALTETLLIMAARADHVAHTIKPALDAGTWVLCDRFFDSTRVYQGIAKGIDRIWLEQLYHLLFGTLKPDHTILLDIDPAIGLGRAAARRGHETRFEGLPLAFHQTLREGFLHLAKAEPHRFITIDASFDMAAVSNAIRDQLAARGIPHAAP